MPVAADKDNEIIRETAQLIQAFKAGDKMAFDRLVTLYAPKLYRTAYGLLMRKRWFRMRLSGLSGHSTISAEIPVLKLGCSGS